MDHSVQGYLERRSTEELRSILKYCLDINRFRQYEDSIRIILKILQKRYEETPHEIPQYLYEMWDRIVEGKTDLEEK